MRGSVRLDTRPITIKLVLELMSIGIMGFSGTAP
jgi:hypothetical protein